MGGLVMLALACAAFLGSHYLMSHPFRAQLVGLLGERLFFAIYSLVALLSFGLMVLAWLAAPGTAPLWEVGEGLWAIGTAIMLVASLLLVGSFVGNPALPTGGAAPRLPDRARGVFAITRHPMMWSFALWGFAHILVYPIAANIILSAAIILLALVGSALQDRKKTQLQPAVWPAWKRRTSYLPFAAIVAGRASAKAAWPGLLVLVLGTLLWLAASWAHLPLAGFAAGIWRWLPLG